MAIRALVTGCAGFIGSHLTESLLRDGHGVVGVDCFNNNYARASKLRNLEQVRDYEGFEFVPLDLAFGELFDLVADCDVIFHLAAEPGVRASWGDRFAGYVRNNIQATQHLLAAANESHPKRFVYASSSSVYGEADSYPTSEATLPRPHSPYGVTKLAAEHLCRTYHVNYGVETVCLRYFSVYGPRQRPDMAFNIFSRAAAQDKQIEVFGDGNQTRDFTFVEDVVAATRRASETSDVAGEIFNVGGGSHITLRSTLEMISEFAGRELDIHYLPREKGDVRDTLADIRHAQEKLGFVAGMDFRDGLLAEFEWAAQLDRSYG